MSRTSKNQNGQVLVEIALIVPVFIAAAAVFIQLLFLCRNLMVMQVAAFQSARQMATSDASSNATALQRLQTWNALWGRVTPPTFNRSSELEQPWRTYSGITTVSTPGYLVTATCQATFWPRGWDWLRLPLKATAEFPAEPPIPGES